MPENPYAFDPNACNPLESLIEWAASLSNVLPDEPTCIPTLGLNGSDIVLLNCDGTEVLNLTTAGGGAAPNAFGTIVVATQSDVVADAAPDTLTLVAGANIAITTNASTDTITIACTGGAGTQNLFETVSDGTHSCVADSTTDTLTLRGVDGVIVVANPSTDTFEFSLDFATGYTGTAPIVVSGAGAISVTTGDGITSGTPLKANIDTAAYLQFDGSSPKKIQVVNTTQEVVTGADLSLAHSGTTLTATLTLTKRTLTILAKSEESTETIEATLTTVDPCDT